MSSNQDARPFVDLKKDAEEFREKFDEDIAECMNCLDAKITALICDPDSLGSTCIRPNAAAEFSRAKYDIFITVKKLFTQKEREWTDYISEMKKLFLENVEIFLAGTKLEVKLPPASSFGPRKSPGNRKSTSVANSFINSFAKSITEFRAPRQNQDVSSKFLEGTSNVSNHICDKDSSSAGSEDEALGGKKSPKNAVDIALLPLLSSSKSRKSSSLDVNTSLSTSSHRSSVNKSDLDALADENIISEEKESVNVPVPSKKRKGRPAAKNKVQNSAAKDYTSNSDENTASEEAEINEVPVLTKGRRGRQPAKKKVNSEANKNHTDNSNENTVAEVEIDVAPIPPKGRRGRQAAKTKVDNSAAKDHTSNSDENTASEEAEMIEVPVLTKGRRGRQPVQKKVDNSAAIQKTSSSNEDMTVQESDAVSNQVTSRGRRGRPVAKQTVNAAMLQNASNNFDKIEESDTKNDEVLVKGRKGKQLVKNKDEIVFPKAPARGRRAAKAMIEEETSEEDIIPDPVPAKTAPRRKTLLPNSNTALDIPDIIPGISMANKSKRKTMSAVSEFETAAPSKRLKLSSRRDVSIEEKDDTVGDNLLESDEVYSDWMSLKNVDGKIPTCPAIFELKVWRAKKSAYIGECENLRRMLTLYKLRQNSGHKHLDKFIDRNYNDIQVRFEAVDSLSDAKREVKNRIKTFATQHKTTPAYN